MIGFPPDDAGGWGTIYYPVSMIVHGQQLSGTVQDRAMLVDASRGVIDLFRYDVTFDTRYSGAPDPQDQIFGGTWGIWRAWTLGLTDAQRPANPAPLPERYIVAPTPPQRPNHNFLGWFTSEAAAAAATDSTGAWNFSTPITGNVDLFAGWAPRTPDEPNVSIIKIAYPQAVNGITGGTVTYALAIENTGELPLTDLVVTDLLPAPLTNLQMVFYPITATNNSSGNLLEVELGTLLPNTSVAIIFTADVPAGTVAQYIENIARVESDYHDIYDTDSEEVEVVVTLPGSPNVSIEKMVMPNTIDGAVGGEVTYVLIVTNTGGVPLTDLEVTDPLDSRLTNPSGLTFFPINSGLGNLSGGTLTAELNSLAPGGSVIITFTANIAAGTAAGTIPNTARVESDAHDIYDTSSAVVTVTAATPGVPNVTISKTVSPGTLSPGGTATYALVITNTGTIPLTDLEVTDALDALLTNPQILSIPAGVTNTSTGNNLSFDIDNLPVGATATIVFTADVANTAENGNTIENLATVRSELHDLTDTDAATINVIAIPNAPALAISKTVSPGTLAPGGMATYVLVVTNTGNVNLTNVVATDPLPATLTNLQILVQPSGVTNNSSGNSLSFNIANLPTGASATFVFTANVVTTAENGDEIINIATATNTTHNLSATASATINVVATPDAPALAITKTVSPGTLSPDSMATYVLVVTNTGNIDLSNVAVVDPLPAALTNAQVLLLPAGTTNNSSGNNLSFTIVNLPAGASATIVFTADVVATAQDGDEIINIATATNTVHNLSATATATINVVEMAEVPAVSIAKTASPAAATPGSAITYVLVVSNTGNVPLEDLLITDPLHSLLTNPTMLSLPSGVTNNSSGNNLSFTLANLAVGASATFIFTADVVVTAQNGDVIPNTARVDDFENNLFDTSSANVSVVAPIDAPAVAISKVATPTTVSPGDTITYVLVISNLGNVALNNLLVTDTLNPLLTNPQTVSLPGGITSTTSGSSLSFTIPNLPEGANTTIVFTADVVATAQNGDTIPNTAEVFDSANNLTATDSAVVNVVVTPNNPAVSIAKTVSTATVSPGDTVTYVLVITNTGNIPLSNLVVTDPLHALLTNPQLLSSSAGVTDNSSGNNLSFTIANLAVGASATIVFTVDVVCTAENGDTIPNIATVTNAEHNLSATDNADVNVVVAGNNPGVAITKTASPGVVSPGGTVTYALVVTNTGNTPLANLVVTDPLHSLLTNPQLLSSPGGVVNNSVGNNLSFTIPNLAIGASATIVFTADVISTAQNGDTIPNIATVVSAEHNLTATANASVSVVAVPNAPAVTISKTASPGTVSPNGTITYVLVISNTGNTTLTNLVVTDPLHSRLTNPQMLPLPSGVTNNSVGNNLSFTIASLAAGASTTIAFTANVVSTAQNGDTIPNIATVFDATNNLTATDNATVTVTVTPGGGNGNGGGPVLSPNLVMSKSADVPNNSHVIVGQAITYTITVRNNGNAASGNVLITDTIPNGMTLVPNSATPSASISGNTLSWNIASIAVGETVNVSFQVTVNALPNGVFESVFRNTARVNGNATNTITHTLRGLVKNPDRATVSVGETISWTLRGFHNPTSNPVANFTIVDMPSAGLNFVSGNIPAFTNSAGVTYDIRTRTAGSTEWVTQAANVSAANAFTFSVPQPGNLHYTEIGLFFGNVPVGFGLGDEIVLTFIVGDNPPGHTLTNMFWVRYDNIEIPGICPEPPVIVPPGDGAPEGTQGSTTQPTPLIPFSPVHHAYMIGDTNGNIRPGASITRAEVATIFFRLITDDYRTQMWTQANPFPDVQINDWFNNAVSTMANAGVIVGMPDGSFQPNRAITRAEFAVAMTRFFEDLPMHGQTMFPDIRGHWAAEEINAAARMGWVTGMPNGNFEPDRAITRAEAAALVNRILLRLPRTANDLLPGMVVWPDNTNVNVWYYLHIQEASNSNEFIMQTDGIHKTWTELINPRMWEVLERPTSQPRDIIGRYRPLPNATSSIWSRLAKGFAR